jgi:hypothetical protein
VPVHDIGFLRLIGRVVAFAIDDNFNLRQAEAAQRELEHQNERLNSSIDGGWITLGGFNFLMAWHPRINTDAGHIWLRQAIRETGIALSSA